MLLTIDDYYDISFYNECKEALKNNGIEFKEFISIKAPFLWYFEVQDKPSFINFDVVPKAYAKFLVNKITALKPNDDYIYERRASYTNKKGLNHYGINDALRAGQSSGQGVFFNSTKETILRLSKDFPRKIYYFGRYFNRKYRVFFSDNTSIMNLIDSADVLIESSSFKNITQLESELNFKIFKLQDRLLKLSETPYVLEGKYYPPQSVRPEISDKYTLT